MAFKDTWVDKVDGVDGVLAEDINSVANEVIAVGNDKEDKANKVGDIDEATSPDQYPSIGAIFQNNMVFEEYLGDKEDIENKATVINETTINNTKYPTTQAVVDTLAEYEITENKVDVIDEVAPPEVKEDLYPNMGATIDFVNSRDNLRLIRTITLGEDSTQATITADKQGYSFALTEAKIIINGTAINTETGTPESIPIRCQMTSDTYRYDFWGSANSGTTTFRNSYVLYLTELGNLNSTCKAELNTLTGNIVGNTQYISNYGTDLAALPNYAYKAANFVIKSVDAVPNMTYFKFTAVLPDHVIQAGTIIEIWGR